MPRPARAAAGPVVDAIEIGEQLAQQQGRERQNDREDADELAG